MLPKRPMPADVTSTSTPASPSTHWSEPKESMVTPAAKKVSACVGAGMHGYAMCVWDCAHPDQNLSKFPPSHSPTHPITRHASENVQAHKRTQLTS